MYSLTDLCFLCLTRHQNIKNIASKDIDGVVVEEKLRCFLSELVNFKPEIPKTVCVNCLENVNFIYSFRQKCLQNVSTLEDYLHKITRENESHFLAPLIDHKDEKDPMETDNQNFDVKCEDVELGETFISSELEDIKAEENVAVKKEPEDLSDNEPSGSDSITEKDSKDNAEPFSHYYDFQDGYMEDEEEFNEESNSVQLNLLPEKSKDRYEKEYCAFYDWRKKKRITNTTDEIMLEYFTEKSKSLKSSTLWSQYSMLKTTLIFKEQLNIGRFMKLKAFLRCQASGYKAKKPRSFTKDEINRFLTEAPDESYLMMKVALIMGVSGGCNHSELLKLTVDDIQDKDNILIVTIPERKLKNQSIFTISGTNMIDKCRKYLNLRPTHKIDHRRLFICYKLRKCTAQPVGKNSFTKIPKLIAEYLNLPDPEMYNGHSIKKSSTIW